MIASFHVASGAAGGALAGSRGRAVALGAVLHALGDRVPHGDIPSHRFETVTAATGVVLLALPPRLLLTVTFCGLVARLNRPEYRPPPSFPSVPISAPVAVTNARRVADELVLVPSIRTWPEEYSARVIDTVSVCAGGGGGAADGLTVSVAVRVDPPNEAVIVTVVVAGTLAVVTEKLAADAPDATVTVAGTAAAAALLLVRETAAEPAAAWLSVTVPVDPAPPVTLVGLTATPASEAELGGGAEPAVRAIRMPYAPSKWGAVPRSVAT